MRRTFLLVLFLCAVAAGQSSQRGTIDGVVILADSSETVGGATVQLGIFVGFDFKVVSSATTDGTGHFTVSGPPDDYMLHVAQPGLVRPLQRSMLRVKLEAGDRIKGARVPMLRAGSVSGRVLDENGQPRAANVELLSLPYRDGSSYTYGFRGGKSNTQGEFELDFVYPGRYLLSVSALQNDPSLSVIYYPGVTTPDEAVPLDVGAGTRLAGMDVQLRRRDTYRARFSVSSATPLPPETKMQFWMRAVGHQYQTGSVSTTFSTAPDGSFVSMPLTPGEYTIEMSSRSPFDGTKGWPIPAGRVTFAIKDRDVDLGIVSLTTGRDIPGRMIFKDVSAPRENAMPIVVRAVPMDFGLVVVPPNAVVAGDGSFRIDHFPDNRLSRVSFENLPKDVYVESMRYAGTNVLTQGLPSNGDLGTLDIVVTGPGGTVSGTTRDARNEAFGEIHVVLIPPESQRGPAVAFPAKMSDANGRFTFSNVPAGQYSVLALEDEVYWSNDQFYQRPEFLQEYERLGTKVNVTRGSKQNIDVRAVPLAKRWH